MGNSASLSSFWGAPKSTEESSAPGQNTHQNQSQYIPDKPPVGPPGQPQRQPQKSLVRTKGLIMTRFQIALRNQALAIIMVTREESRNMSGLT